MLFAAERGGSVYFTANGFANVFASGDMGQRQWSSIACSAAGKEALAAVHHGALLGWMRLLDEGVAVLCLTLV